MPAATFWNVAIFNTRMHLSFMLYSLVEIRSGLSLRTAWASGDTDGGLWYWDTVCYYCGRDHTQPHHNSTFPTRQWRGMAILRATMATSLQRGKGFGRAQWVFLERCCCCCCWGLHWVCAVSVPSSGFSCHRYDGALFADSHGAECGNGHHLSHRTLTLSALSSQGRRLSRQGQTITQHYSLSCNEPGIEKSNQAMTADTILWFKEEKHRNEMDTKIQSHLALLRFYSFNVSCYLCFSCGGNLDLWKPRCLLLLSPHVLLQTWISKHL